MKTAKGENKGIVTKKTYLCVFSLVRSSIQAALRLIQIQNAFLTECLLPTKGTETPSAEPGIKTTNWVVPDASDHRWRRGRTVGHHAGPFLQHAGGDTGRVRLEAPGLRPARGEVTGGLGRGDPVLACQTTEHVSEPHASGMIGEASFLFLHTWGSFRGGVFFWEAPVFTCDLCKGVSGLD